MSRIKKGVCGYCNPGMPTKEKKLMEQVNVIRLPNGVDACRECHIRITTQRYREEQQ